MKQIDPTHNQNRYRIYERDNEYYVATYNTSNIGYAIKFKTEEQRTNWIKQNLYNHIQINSLCPLPQILSITEHIDN